MLQYSTPAQHYFPYCAQCSIPPRQQGAEVLPPRHAAAAVFIYPERRLAVWEQSCGPSRSLLQRPKREDLLFLNVFMSGSTRCFCRRRAERCKV